MSLQRRRRLLAGSEWKDETFLSQDLRGAIAVGAIFTNCTFRKCKLSRGKFGGAFFSGCHFESCEINQAILQSRISDCTFVECDLDESLFDSAIIERTHFERCRLEYAVFSRATILGGGFLGCQLHGTYLDVAESVGVDFTGSNMWGAVIPLGCAAIVGNRFDHRQLHMLLGIVNRAVLDAKDHEYLELIGEKKVFRLVEKLIARESGEPSPVEEEIHGVTA
jgi:uncharacterized protein YjbI with pentapeptide repeats